MKKETDSHKIIFHIISNVITWSIFVILALIALFLIYYVIAAHIYAEKGEEYKPKFALYTIISGSMEPTIKVYDVVFDVKVDDPSTIKVGDVITFVSTSSLVNGTTVTHRVKEIVETDEGIKFKTKGDNNPVADDALVEPNKILGKVAFKIPQLGRVQFLILKSGGWLFLILIPSLGIVIYDILKIFRLDKTKKKIDKTINTKDDNVLDRDTQDKLKQKIKDRLEGKNNKELPDYNEDEASTLRSIALQNLYKEAEKFEDNTKEIVVPKVDLDKVIEKINNEEKEYIEDKEEFIDDDLELPKIADNNKH